MCRIFNSSKYSENLGNTKGGLCFRTGVRDDTSRGFLMSQTSSWGCMRSCRHCYGLRQVQGHLGLQSQKDSPLKLLLNTTAKSRPLIWGHRPGPSSTSATWLGWGRKTTAQQNLDYLGWCYPVVQHGPWCTWNMGIFTQHKELEAKHSSAGFCIAPAGHSPPYNPVSFKQAQIHCSVDFKRDWLSGFQVVYKWNLKGCDYSHWQLKHLLPFWSHPDPNLPMAEKYQMAQKKSFNWHGGKKNLVDVRQTTLGNPGGRANLAGILRSEKYLPWHGKDVHQLKRWLGQTHLHCSMSEGLIGSYTLNILVTHTYKISVPNAMVGPGQHTHPLLWKTHWK